MARLGKLEVFERIAHDETASSYLARWDGETWVVLRRAENPEAKAALAEAMSVAVQLDSPHVVRTLDPSEAAGADEAMLLEEYVEGERLSEWAEELESLPWQVGVALIRDAARGAQHIHSNATGQSALATAMLWPGRLVVGFDGTVKVIDPCAELRGARPPEHALRDYAAPEQAQFPSPAACVYSLGRILEALVPYHDDDPAQLERVRSRMLHDAPEQRYGTPGELAAALDALLADPEPVRAYFDSRFAGKRAQHEAMLHGVSEAAMASGFTDEIRTTVLQRDAHGLPPAAPTKTDENAAPPSGMPSSERLADFEERATEQINLRELGLGALAADEDESLRTLPFRREILAKLKRSEHENLGRGGSRVAVVSTPPPAPHQSATPTPDASVIVTPSAPESDPARAAEAKPARRPRPPRVNADATVVMRAIVDKPTFRLTDLLLVGIAVSIVAAVAYYVLGPR